MSVIKTERINKIYKTKAERIVAVREVSIDIRAGEFVGIIGSSGSGKSTLMNILGCLDKPSGGKYFFENRNIANFKEGELTALRRDNIGFVFQKFNLIQTLNALENVELPLLYAKMPKKKRRQKAKTALETVGLENRINHKPYDLDSDSTKQIMKILKDLNKKGKTVIIITHDREIAEQTDRKIIVKNGRVDVSV